MVIFNQLCVASSPKPKTKSLDCPLLLLGRALRAQHIQRLQDSLTTDGCLKIHRQLLNAEVPCRLSAFDYRLYIERAWRIERQKQSTSVLLVKVTAIGSARVTKHSDQGLKRFNCWAASKDAEPLLKPLRIEPLRGIDCFIQLRHDHLTVHQVAVMRHMRRLNQDVELATILELLRRCTVLSLFPSTILTV